jgi:DNA-binding transcriptional regulator PaaX
LAKRRTLTEKILLLIGASVKEGLALSMYPYLGLGKYFKKYRGSLSKAVYDLLDHGYLVEVEIEGERYLRMTSKGRLKILKKKIFKKWDGLWRIIAFDIEEKRKKTRDVFRIKLSEIGCKPIQKSVWITPNDISYELEEIIDILNLHNNVDYFISKAITNPDKLLEKFKLSNFKE